MDDIRGDTTLTVRQDNPVRLEVTPRSPTIVLDTTQQFIATGIFSDATTQNLTTAVLWESSAPGVATISNTTGSQGLATSMAVGTTTIRATVGSIGDATMLTVRPALDRIEVTPRNPTITLGTQQQFVATGIFSDATTQNLTTAVLWESSIPGVAAISNAADSKGLATSVAVGTTTIRATMGAIRDETTLRISVGGSISGKVTNAQTGQPLPGATVQLMQNGVVLRTTTTNATGDYTFSELASGTYTLEVSAPNFVTSTRGNVQVITGQNTLLNFVLSPVPGRGELRLVLTWGQFPSDLDSHLWLPVGNPFHIFYLRKGNVNACPFAMLDVDDTSSFGPETITISRRFTGVYVYAVHNFSGSPAITTSQARVEVFDERGLLKTFSVPTTGTGLWWRVLTIDGATGNITEINAIGNDPSPYADTAAGCTTIP
jgi:uncharacterized protein YfaP (DUF2135 family)